MEPVVIRYLDGRMAKGYAAELGGTEDVVAVRLSVDSAEETRIPIRDLKAIFYVRSLEGDEDYHEQKRYGLRDRLDRKVIVRFKDGEFLVGFLDSPVPWKHGFFLSHNQDQKGFYLVPADDQSNNIRVFVVSSAISDVTTP
jgi:hypothetical protein